MSKAEIYYFSGTGNSLIVARDIARKTNGTLIPVTSVIDQESIKTDADLIGIVFPVYFWGIPRIIAKFAGKLENISSKYLFAVCTYGGIQGATVKMLDQIIKTRGGKLAAGFAVQMPGNYIVEYDAFPVMLQKIKFNNWRKKLEVIYEYVNARKTGKFETLSLFSIIFAPIIPLAKMLILANLNKKTNSAHLNFMELIPLLDIGFHSDDKCNGCGTCAKVCPVSNIKIINDRPSWRRNCEQCYACLQWCPKQAIQFEGKTLTRKRYHHPEVEVSDMFR